MRSPLGRRGSDMYDRPPQGSNAATTASRVQPCASGSLHGRVEHRWKNKSVCASTQRTFTSPGPWPRNCCMAVWLVYRFLRCMGPYNRCMGHTTAIQRTHMVTRCVYAIQPYTIHHTAPYSHTPYSQPSGFEAPHSYPSCLTVPDT